ncbi:MAG TPA: hypothetical protein VM238_15620 [Phycisphaerae bacterium]|nr:hypothetical protein [Phycisphaerae bacterium]
MCSRSRLAACLLMAALLPAGGCQPQRAPPAGWSNPLDPMEARLPQDPNDTNYVLGRMEFGRWAIVYGCPLRAKPRLMEAFEQLEAERDNVGAALSSERLKYYKGETYERAMLGVYLGMIEYQAGRYNEARILLTRALDFDRGAVVKDTTPPEVGEDFGLAYYWLGKTYVKLGDEGNANVAFRKVTMPTPRKEKDAAREREGDCQGAAKWLQQRSEGETWVWQTFHDAANKPDLYVEGAVNLTDPPPSLADAPAALPDAAPKSPVLRTTEKPDEFFTPAYQADANLVLTVELGRGPFKYLGGLHGERTEFGRPCIRPHHVRVYLDGHYAGPAFQTLDLWDQAATQDRIDEKDAAQTTKGVLKEILSHVPYASMASGQWDVTGDMRHWTSLPGRVCVFAAKVAPGPHTIRLLSYDINDNLLTRWTSTWYGVAAPETGEAGVLLQPTFDRDNTLPPELVEKAMATGSQPGFAGTF